jgi:hypothetical protein
MTLSVYQRIVRAAQRGKGIRLTANEVGYLARVGVIAAHVDSYIDDTVEHLCFIPWEERKGELFVCGGDGWYKCVDCASYIPGGGK